MAAQHSARLAANPTLRCFVADKLDAVVFNRGPLAPSLLSQLLHLDQPLGGGSASSDDGRRGDAATAAASGGGSEPLSFGVRVSVACPKFGVALSMRSPASMPMPPPADPAGATRRPPCVQLTLQALEVELAPSGRELRVPCGGLGTGQACR